MSTTPSTRAHRSTIVIGGALAVCAVALALTSQDSQAADASTPVNLGTTAAFAVLAGGGITNTGTTTITGDIGSFPTIDQTITGVVLIGTNQAGNAVTQQAESDLVTAYDDAAGALPPTTVETELGGKTLVAGVYRAEVELGLTGALTLDGGRSDGRPSNGVFIFQTPTTLITEAHSSIVLTGGAQACNVFWQVGSAADFKSGTSFQGTVMANSEAITAGAGATFVGRLLARTAAVTLNNNTITAPGCEIGPEETTPTPTATPTTGGTDATTGADASTGTDAPPTESTSTDDSTGDDISDDTTSDDDSDTTVADSARESGLPGTGGARLWLVVGGLALVAAGSALLFRRLR